MARGILYKYSTLARVNPMKNQPSRQEHKYWPRYGNPPPGLGNHVKLLVPCAGRVIPRHEKDPMTSVDKSRVPNPASLVRYHILGMRESSLVVLMVVLTPGSCIGA